MGIKGLLPFLKDVQALSNIRTFKGSTVAVDTYSWLHRGVYGCVEQIAYGKDDGQYVAYCMRYVRLLISWGLKPILVFDGRNLPAKELTEKERRERRQLNRTKALALMREGKQAEARRFLERCIDITPAMAARVIQAARAEGVDCIVAPYEADAQLAYLSRCGIAQVIISEDSDLLLFGCERVFFKLDVNGNGVLIEQSSLPKLKAFRNQFTFEKFLAMCVIAGCDYLPSLPGIGIAKACKFVFAARHDDIVKALKRMPMYLNMPSLEVTDKYVADFVSACNTFRHQLVFDPIGRRLIPLTEYPPGLDPAALACAGEYMSDEQALQLAIGNISCKDGRRLADHKLEEQKALQPQKGHSSLHSPAAHKQQHIQPSIWDPLFTAKKSPWLAPPAAAAVHALVDDAPCKVRKAMSPARRSVEQQQQHSTDRRRNHEANGRCTRLRLAPTREITGAVLSPSPSKYGSDELVKELLSAYAFSAEKPGVVETTRQFFDRCDSDVVDEGLGSTIGSGGSSGSSVSLSPPHTGSSMCEQLTSVATRDDSLARSPDRQTLRAVQPRAAVAARSLGPGLDAAGERESTKHQPPLQQHLPPSCVSPRAAQSANDGRSPGRPSGDASPSCATTPKARRSNVFATQYKKEQRFSLDGTSERSPTSIVDNVSVAGRSPPVLGRRRQAAAGATAPTHATPDVVIKSKYFFRDASSPRSSRSTSAPAPADGGGGSSSNSRGNPPCDEQAKHVPRRGGSSLLEAFEKVDPVPGLLISRCAGGRTTGGTAASPDGSGASQSPGGVLSQQGSVPSVLLPPAAAKAMVEKKQLNVQSTPATPQQQQSSCRSGGADQQLSTGCFSWQSGQRGRVGVTPRRPDDAAAERPATIGSSLPSPSGTRGQKSKKPSTAGLRRSGPGSLLAYLRPIRKTEEAGDSDGTRQTTVSGTSARLSPFKLHQQQQKSHRIISETAQASVDTTTGRSPHRHCGDRHDMTTATMTTVGGRKRHATASSDDDCSPVDARSLRSEKASSHEGLNDCDATACCSSSSSNNGGGSPAKRQITHATACNLQQPQHVSPAWPADRRASGGRVDLCSTPARNISSQLVKFKYQSKSCPTRTRVAHLGAR